MIKFHCACGKKIAVEDAAEGRRVKCPRCAEIVVAHSEAPAVTASQDPLEQLAAARMATVPPPVFVEPPAPPYPVPDPAPDVAIEPPALPAPVVPYATPMPAASPAVSSTAAAAAWTGLRVVAGVVKVFFAAIGLFVVASVIIYLFARDRSTSAPIPAATIALPPAPAPPAPRLTVQRAWTERRGGEESAAVRVRNDEVAPINVLGVLLNGEHECRLADKDDDGDYSPSDKKRWPVTLTIGESLLAFHRVAHSYPPPAGQYEKDVIFVVVITDRGANQYHFAEPK